MRNCSSDLCPNISWPIFNLRKSDGKIRHTKYGRILFQYWLESHYALFSVRKNLDCDIMKLHFDDIWWSDGETIKVHLIFPQIINIASIKFTRSMLFIHKISALLLVIRDKRRWHARAVRITGRLLASTKCQQCLERKLRNGSRIKKMDHVCYH